MKFTFFLKTNQQQQQQRSDNIIIENAICLKTSHALVFVIRLVPGEMI